MLFKTPGEVMRDLASRIKKRRLSLNLSQQGLAIQSGVSLGSIKRFEHTGHIALLSLMNIALVLNCLDEFDTLISQPVTPKSLNDLIALTTPRKKGTRHAI